jgi:hypothetical protein
MANESVVRRIEDKETHEWHYSGWFEYAKALNRWGKKADDKKKLSPKAK